MFSSNRGGASNLWIMRASGGPATQITRGAGPDVAMRVSADGRTALYLARSQRETIGWWDVASGETGSVTREEEPLGIPIAPSTDGSRLAVTVRDPDAVSLAQPVAVMNRDGSGRRTVIAAEQAPRAFDWSPDDRTIAWAASRASGDSLDLHLVDVATGEETMTRAVPAHGRVTWLQYLSADTLLVLDRLGSLLYSLSQGRVVARSPEREFWYRSRVPGFVVFISPRSSAAPGVYVRPASGGAARRVVPIEWIIANSPGGDFLYCWPDSLGLSRLDLPSGRLRKLGHVPAGLTRDALVYPNATGRVVFWARPRSDSKLVLVENLRR